MRLERKLNYDMSILTAGISLAVILAFTVYLITKRKGKNSGGYVYSVEALTFSRWREKINDKFSASYEKTNQQKGE